ncbi:MAG: hypothetical protein AB7V42_07485 [Thermoleophilia bacterium]
MPHHDDPRLSTIATRLDRAHAELPTPELAQLLLALEQPAARLSEAQNPYAADTSSMAPDALAALLPIQRDLAGAARSRERRVSMGRWLAAYIDEIAARPRGAAVPVTLAA